MAKLRIQLPSSGTDWLWVVACVPFLLVAFYWLFFGPGQACYNGDPISETPNYCMRGR